MSGAERLLSDEAHFLTTLLKSPRLTGAVAPSGRHLARAMARAVGEVREGWVVELGPGTGPVTDALIEHGVARDRLALVEYDAGFCQLLTRRFAPAVVVQGDAYDLLRTLKEFAGRPVAAVISSLPLLNQPPALRVKLVDDAFALMGPTGIFVQFTYGFGSPVPRQACANKYSAQCSGPIWRNLPPARVWTYRADPDGVVAKTTLSRPRSRIRGFWTEHARSALAAAARRRRNDAARESQREA